MMFSKNYFSYLLKSKKYLLLLVFLVTIFNCVITDDSRTAIYIQAIFSTILSYVMTVDVFFYIHDKKAIDSYFTIPVSRKALLITGIIFNFLVTYLPLASSIILFAFKTKMLSFTLLLLVKMAFACMTILIIHTAIYLLGNNIIDGIIMLGAYSMIPLFLLGAIDYFLHNYVCGGRVFDLSFIGYLSPIYMGFVLLSPLSEIKFKPNEYVMDHIPQLPSFIFLVVMTLIAIYILNRNYINRKAERAGMPSNSFFTYPFIIALYVCIVLIFFVSMYDFRNLSILAFLKETIFMYLILFAIYIAANFIHRRKFYISIKMIIGFALAIIISLLFAQTAINTRGFGFSDRYLKEDDLNNIMIYKWIDYEHLSDADEEIIAYVNEQSGLDNKYIDISIYTKNSYASIKDESISKLNEYRKRATDNFYSRNYQEENGHAHLDIGKNGIYQYSYLYIDNFNLSDLMTFAKDNNLQVIFNLSDGSYKMNSDGNLELYERYEPSVT